MRRAFAAFAAIVALMLAAPARAAEPPNIECPLTSLTAEERSALDEYIAEQGPQNDPRFAAYLEASRRCLTRFHWSRAQGVSATTFAFMSAVVAATRRLTAARGVDISELERLLLADRSVMDATDDAQRQAVRAFSRQHGGIIGDLVGRTAPDAQVASWIGLFIYGRAAMERARRDFADN